MTVIAVAVTRLFHVQSGMFPWLSTLEYASVVKPLFGKNDTGVAAASVSVLNEVTSGPQERQQPEHGEHDEGDERADAAGAGEAFTDAQAGALGEPAAGGRWTAGAVVGSVAMAVIRRSCGTSAGPGRPR